MAIRNSSSGKNVIKVAVLMGGPSAEYEISINTGKMVLKSLDKKKYEAKPIVITRDGLWPISQKDLKNNFDVVFIAMHGEYGEDGTIQKILDKIGIPYTGSGHKASKLGMEKIAFARLMKKNGILTPEFCADKNDSLLEKLGFPLVVKPADRGSSVGVTLVKSLAGLSNAIKYAKKYSEQIMLQKYIKGREFTCGVVEINPPTFSRSIEPSSKLRGILEEGGGIKGKPRAILPTEIIPKNPFFDYEAKYVAGASQEITPPSNMPEDKIKELQKLALRIHRLVGCCDYSRTDFIINTKGEIYTLEINTLPGMTANSLLPGAAKASGIGFVQLLDIIISNVLIRNP